MTLIHSCRSSARATRARFVPGGLACAASGRRTFAPLSLQLSPTPKMAPSLFTAKAVTRLAPVYP